MWLLALLAACPERAEPPPSSTPTDSATEPAPAPATTFDVAVTIDGDPAPDVILSQPGTALRWTTDADGRATVDLDPAADGGWWVVAAHPDARIRGGPAPLPGDELSIALTRFDPADNEAYVFQDPGTPTRNQTTDQCNHCHVTIGADWWDSPHRAAASNPTVHDLYAGTAAALADPGSCAAAGGAWGAATEPGSGATVDRCHLGGGVLAQGGTGACADCHAPGIDGPLGGRDLLEARGFAYEGGVHCDVCHKVESVDLAAEAGVAGRLRVVRPSEPEDSPGLGPFAPLMFGPLPDVPHVRMGSVYRELFHQPELCAGCHQLDQPVLVPGATVDLGRWPDGRLPVHSTYAEWLAGPMNPAAPCTSCHMPPDPTVGNSADLADLAPGPANGWEQVPGSVHHHSWIGPRQRDSGMLELAATLSVATTWDGPVLTAEVTVKNVGPGHAIPTGEPLRGLVLLVQATCAGVDQPPIGGDVVPDWGGAYQTKVAGDDWTRWDALPGDVVRVVRRAGAFRDYVGYGPFGDGTFAPEEKGLPVEEAVGAATVLAVVDGVVTFDHPLPAGDVASLGAAPSLPEDGSAAAPRAGAAGFGFARVLVGAEGQRMVPHFAAVDVASDNRLLPQQSATTHHSFAPGCADPQVTAALVHRAYPWALAAERRWTLVESVMAEATR